jgi:hypothetical protein
MNDTYRIDSKDFSPEELACAGVEYTISHPTKSSTICRIATSSGARLRRLLPSGVEFPIIREPGIIGEISAVESEDTLLTLQEAF